MQLIGCIVFDFKIVSLNEAPQGLNQFGGIIGGAAPAQSKRMPLPRRPILPCLSHYASFHYKAKQGLPVFSRSLCKAISPRGTFCNSGYQPGKMRQLFCFFFVVSKPKIVF